MRNTIYLQRTLEETLSLAARQFSVVVVTGPRQSGKTTIIRHLFGKTFRYVSLDEIHLRRLAADDPRLFLDEYKPPVIIDEIQHVPALLNYIKAAVDREREKKGQFLLTGSQVFGLMRGVSESLAGRAAILQIYPMSLRERCDQTGPPAESSAVFEDIIRGGYPELVVNPKLNRELWFSSYVQSYLERDVRALSQVGDLAGFERFLFAAASRAGSFINYSDLARDLGVAVNTIKNWFSVLEAGGQVYLLRPYHRNLGKRVIKRPKLYFLDTGLLCHLTGLSDVRHARRGPMAGVLFENAVFNEFHRYFVHQGRLPPLYYFRTDKGLEVDFLLEWQGKIYPYEVKLKSTPARLDALNLMKFKKLFGEVTGPGRLICLAAEEIPLAEDIRAVPYSRLSDRDLDLVHL